MSHIWYGHFQFPVIDHDYMIATAMAVSGLAEVDLI